jgi:soluble lytic murein transglycosylase
MTIDDLPRGARCLLLALILVGFGLLPANAQERATQRESFRAAYAAATRNPPGDWKKLAIGLENYPLYPYLEAAALRRNIAKAPRADVERFLARWPDTLPESDVRETYLRELARRDDWTSFRVFWKGSRARDLQCDELQARLAAGEKLDFEADVAPLWSSPRSLPGACDAVFGALRASGALTDARVWDRLAEAASAGNTESAASAAALLEGREREAAERIIGAVRNPATTLAKAEQWPDDPRARRDRLWPCALRATRQRVGRNAVVEARRPVQMGRGTEGPRTERARDLPLDELFARRARAPQGAARNSEGRHQPRVARAHRARGA